MSTIEELIIQRHPKPEWFVIEELRDGTGSMQRRSVDVTAFNAYPSKKFWRVAYEVKRSRSDFMRELQQPEKRAFAETHFHETFFVTSPGVCDPDEVPEGWGLLVTTKAGDKLRQVKAARQRMPEPFTDASTVALLRQASYRVDALEKRLSQVIDFEGESITVAEFNALVEERLRDDRKNLSDTQEMVLRELNKLRYVVQDIQGPLFRLLGLGAEHGVKDLPTDPIALKAEDVSRIFEEALGKAKGALPDKLREEARRMLKDIDLSRDRLRRLIGED